MLHTNTQVSCVFQQFMSLRPRGACVRASLYVSVCVCLCCRNKNTFFEENPHSRARGQQKIVYLYAYTPTKTPASQPLNLTAHDTFTHIIWAYSGGICPRDGLHGQTRYTQTNGIKICILLTWISFARKRSASALAQWTFSWKGQGADILEGRHAIVSSHLRRQQKHHR